MREVATAQAAALRESTQMLVDSESRIAILENRKYLIGVFLNDGSTPEEAVRKPPSSTRPLVDESKKKIKK